MIAVNCIDDNIILDAEGIEREELESKTFTTINKVGLFEKN